MNQHTTGDTTGDTAGDTTGDTAGYTGCGKYNGLFCELCVQMFDVWIIATTKWFR